MSKYPDADDGHCGRPGDSRVLNGRPEIKWATNYTAGGGRASKGDGEGEARAREGGPLPLMTRDIIYHAP